MEKVGEFSQAVITALELNTEVGTPIYLGESNVRHMKTRHPDHFAKYGGRLKRILEEPDFVGIAPDGSIEYIKKFGKLVKLAVRIAHDGEFYVRTLYEVGESRVKNSVKQGQLKSLTKK